MTAATKSRIECSASDKTPKLPVRTTRNIFSEMSRTAEPTEASAASRFSWEARSSASKAIGGLYAVSVIWPRMQLCVFVDQERARLSVLSERRDSRWQPPGVLTRSRVACSFASTSLFGNYSPRRSLSSGRIRVTNSSMKEGCLTMNRSRVLVLSLSVIVAMLWLSFAKAIPAGDDWLPVPPEDLALKDNPASPGANAMILYRRSHVNAQRAAIDGAEDDEYIRIKIFTEVGVKAEANPAIRFFKEESDIEDIRARTIRPDGSVVNFDGKVYEKIVERTGESSYLTKTFSLSNVEPGCIVEYKYREQYKPKLLYSEHWVISGPLFTRDAVFSIAPYIPRSEFDPTLYFRTKNLAPGSLPQRQGNGSYSMEVHNIPAVKEESLMPPLRVLEARVDFFYRNRGESAGETTEQYWNRTGKKWSGELDKFLNKKSVLEEELSKTVAAS